MLVVLQSPEKDLAVTGQDILRIFYPDASISLEDEKSWDLLIKVSARQEGNLLLAGAELRDKDTVVSEETSTDTVPVKVDERNHLKRLVKLALFRLLSKYTNTLPGPWGILTGIRPTKIVHRLLDLGYEKNGVISYLQSGYDMAYEKAELLTDIALRQRPYLLDAGQAARLISVYIGIPFCPTRCAYCSFPAYPVDRHANLLEPFLQALLREIREVGNKIAELGIGVQTVYIGGGTPTVLDVDRLSSLLGAVAECLVSAETREITLEAGRPDTITEEKLAAARNYGITKLSINPQSMNPDTLAKIGRCHQPADIHKSVALARQMGFGNINMDIIVGLPGEDVEDMSHTLREIAAIGPENLTVHTLAVKRASRINEAREDYDLPSLQAAEKMLQMAASAAKKMGMHPYYLYRQKKMVGPLENVGYAREGFDCIYNIQMIEERQTIIGLGGGAGSKFVEPGVWDLTSHYNPKDPETYIGRIDELILLKRKRLAVLTALNR